jgi:hypothetical protein
MCEFEAEVAGRDMSAGEAPAGVGLFLREPLAAGVREWEGAVDDPDATGAAVAPPAAGKLDAEAVQQLLEFGPGRSGNALVSRR